MSTTPTGAFLPPLSNRSSPLSSRRNSADDKHRKSNSRTGSSEGPTLSARRMHATTTAGEQLQAKRAEEERKEREMEAATHSAHFPSPPPNRLSTTSRIAVPLPRDLLPSKRLSQPRRPPLAAASASGGSNGSGSTFELQASWGQRDRQDSTSSFVDEALARATFQALLSDAGTDSRMRQEEEKQTSSQPLSRSHNSYAPPPSKSTFPPSTTSFALASSSSSSTTSDSGLISALTQRVHTLESLTQQQSRQLAAKEQELLQMHVERDSALAAITPSICSAQAIPTSVAANDLQQLRGEYERLVRQVIEMEQFLSDYGLQWIGDNSTTTVDSNNSRTNSSASTSLTSSSPSTLPFHLPTLLQRVEQLNASLPPTSLLISQHSSVTRFQPAPYLLLTLYRDGLTLTQYNHRQQPLRHYESPQAQSLLADILDGFFPSEWRSEWPDGVRVVVSDCSGEKWEEVARRRRTERRQRSWHAFEGAGRRVRETKAWQEQVKADDEAERTKQAEQKERQQKAKEAFLSRLPTKTVSAAGQLVEVKAMVQQLKGDNNNSTDTPPTPSSVWQRLEVKDSDTLTLLRSTANPHIQPPFNPSLNVCTLHVHVQHSSASDSAVLASSSSFLLLLQSHHTLGAVMALLQRHVLVESPVLSGRKWRLHWTSLQPRVVVEMEELGVDAAASNQVSYGRADEKLTLAAAGWRRNCSLFVHVRSL